MFWPKCIASHMEYHRDWQPDACPERKAVLRRKTKSALGGTDQHKVTGK